MHQSPQPSSAQVGTGEPSSMSIVRPFPPPALENVPLLYILDQLHNLATHYWDKPATADCTIIVPITPPRTVSGSGRNQSENIYTHSNNSNLSANVNGAGPSQPARPTRMTSKLHLDYLLAQSTLFRDLFSSSSPSASSSSTVSSSNSQSHLASLPPSRQPTFLPGTTPSHPIVLLPLPDPSSWPHLAHALYFGHCTALSQALDEGSIRWAGCVRNAEYLGLIDSSSSPAAMRDGSVKGAGNVGRGGVKQFLGEWAARRLVADPRGCAPPVVYEAEGEGDAWSDIDDSESDSDSESEFSDERGDYEYGNGDDAMREDWDNYNEDAENRSDRSDRSDTDGSLETLVDDDYTSLYATSARFGKRKDMEMDVDDVDDADDVEVGRLDNGVREEIERMTTEQEVRGDTQRGRSRTRVRPRAPSPSPPGRGRTLCRAF